MYEAVLIRESFERNNFKRIQKHISFTTLVSTGMWAKLTTVD